MNDRTTGRRLSLIYQVASRTQEIAWPPKDRIDRSDRRHRLAQSCVSLVAASSSSLGCDENDAGRAPAMIRASEAVIQHATHKIMRRIAKKVAAAYRETSNYETT